MVSTINLGLQHSYVKNLGIMWQLPQFEKKNHISIVTKTAYYFLLTMRNLLNKNRIVKPAFRSQAMELSFWQTMSNLLTTL